MQLASKADETTKRVLDSYNQSFNPIGKESNETSSKKHLPLPMSEWRPLEANCPEASSTTTLFIEALSVLTPYVMEFYNLCGAVMMEVVSFFYVIVFSK